MIIKKEDNSKLVQVSVKVCEEDTLFLPNTSFSDLDRKAKAELCLESTQNEALFGSSQNRNKRVDHKVTLWVCFFFFVFLFFEEGKEEEKLNLST